MDDLSAGEPRGIHKSNNDGDDADDGFNAVT